MTFLTCSLGSSMQDAFHTSLVCWWILCILHLWPPLRISLHFMSVSLDKPSTWSRHLPCSISCCDWWSTKKSNSPTSHWFVLFTCSVFAVLCAVANYVNLLISHVYRTLSICCIWVCHAKNRSCSVAFLKLIPSSLPPWLFKVGLLYYNSNKIIIRLLIILHNNSSKIK